MRKSDRIDEDLGCDISLVFTIRNVIATHNANIPVLGESEKVVACDFEDGKNIVLEDGVNRH